MGKEKMTEIMGVRVPVLSAREEMELLQELQHEPGIKTVKILSLEELRFAQEHEEVREGLLGYDLLLVETLAVWNETGIDDNVRFQEIERELFTTTFMKYLDKIGKPVFAVWDTAEDKEQYEPVLYAAYPELKVSGEAVLGEMPDSNEALVNAINAHEVEFVLSFASVPTDDIFLMECRQMLHAAVWMSFGRTLFGREENEAKNPLKQILGKILG